jgi:hypothetical protein
MSEPTPEHEHRWVPDRERTGFTCLEHPGESGWDWHVDEVRRLRAELGRVEACLRDEEAQRRTLEDKLVVQEEALEDYIAHLKSLLPQ